MKTSEVCVKFLTELYCTFKLLEKPDESEVATQTYFLEKPVLPTYYVGKVGQDACTQIEPGEVRALNILS